MVEPENDTTQQRVPQQAGAHGYVDPSIEVVGLYDEQGREVGRAPRPRVRAENLRHGASAIVVRNAAGQLYVHRRTDTKDVYPGRYDVAAGGVLQAGEVPAESAVRELAEELGITGVPLVPVGEGDYADEHTTYHAFLYTAESEGPMTHQPEEVAWGGWLDPAELAARIAADRDAFVPDTLALWDDAFRGPRGR